MKAKDWQKAAQLVHERQSQSQSQSQVAMADTSKLSSFSLSELPVGQSGSPTVIHGPYVPLSTSMPVHVPSDNQQTTEATQDEFSFQQVIPNISQQSLYPSLAAMGTSINTFISPSISFSRRVINDIEEHQRRVLSDFVESTNRGTNTSPVKNSDAQEEDTGQKARITPPEMQEETLQPESLETEDTSIKQVNPMQDQDFESLQAQNIGETEVPDVQDTNDTEIQDDGTDSQFIGKQLNPDIPDDQISRASQEDNYHTAIDEDEQDDTIQFGNPVTQPFLSRSIRVHITEVGCLSFMQMLPDYLQAYPPTLTSRCLFANPRDGSTFRYVFK